MRWSCREALLLGFLLPVACFLVSVATYFPECKRYTADDRSAYASIAHQQCSRWQVLLENTHHQTKELRDRQESWAQACLSAVVAKFLVQEQVAERHHERRKSEGAALQRVSAQVKSLSARLILRDLKDIQINELERRQILLDENLFRACDKGIAPLIYHLVYSGACVNVEIHDTACLIQTSRKSQFEVVRLLCDVDAFSAMSNLVSFAEKRSFMALRSPGMQPSKVRRCVLPDGWEFVGAPWMMCPHSSDTY